MKDVAVAKKMFAAKGPSPPSFGSRSISAPVPKLMSPDVWKTKISSGPPKRVKVWPACKATAVDQVYLYGKETSQQNRVGV